MPPKPLLFALAALLAIVAVLLWQLGPSPSAPVAPPEVAPAAGAQQGGQQDEQPQPLARSETAAGNIVRGRVVDDDGEPVADALVGDVAGTAPVAVGADGRFELRTVDAADAADELCLLVLAPAHAARVATFARGGARELDVGDVELLAGAALQGTVVDAAGSAVANALIELRPLARGDWPDAVDLAALFPPVCSDARGAFAFAHVPAGSWELVASAEGCHTARSGPHRLAAGVLQAPPIVLGRGFALAGRVTGPDDAPVAGASVRIRGAGPTGQLDERTVTDVAGRFAFAALPAGAHTLQVGKQGLLDQQRPDVDPSRGEVVEILLLAGLRIEGLVVAAGSGKPVERFAVSVLRLGGAAVNTDGTVAPQLERRIAALRTAAAGATDAAARERTLRVLAELEARLLTVRSGTPPRTPPPEAGEVQPHADGRFTVDGLQAGVYSIGIAAPGFAFARAEPVDLRGGAPAAELRIALAAGCELTGVVVARGSGAPIGGARVELVACDDARAPAASPPSPYTWLFLPPRRPGIVVSTAATDAGGRFAFGSLAAGRYFVAVQHGRHANGESQVADVRGASEVRVELGARAALAGRVANFAPERGAEVLALGGHGVLRTVKVGADGTYRLDDLLPGEYLVRAFPSQSTRYVSRLLSTLFPPHASAAAATDRVPTRDVTLAEGEQRTFDLVLERLPTGSVQGVISINGRPAAGGRTVLSPVDGEAPGAGGQSLRAEHDQLGRFALADVPAGNYLLAVQSSTRQELASEKLTVVADATAVVQREVAAGGLRGRVLAADATPADTLRGSIYVLPGADAEPADLHDWRRSHRVHRIAVRSGAFADECLTPGPALVLLDLRDRKRAVTKVVVPAGTLLDLDLTAGERTR